MSERDDGGPAFPAMVVSQNSATGWMGWPAPCRQHRLLKQEIDHEQLQRRMRQQRQGAAGV